MPFVFTKLRACFGVISHPWGNRGDLSLRALLDGSHPHSTDDVAPRMNDAPVNRKPAKGGSVVRVNSRLGGDGRASMVVRRDEEVHGGERDSRLKLLLE